ncbi:MAG: hypothetical protein ACYC4L_02625 [Chloroflexota bacterium]
MAKTKTLLGCGMGVAGAAVGLTLAASPPARSAAIRLLSHRVQRNVAVERGVAISSSIDRGEWVRIPLVADLSEVLRSVTSRPISGVAWSHFGGFGGRPYSAWLDPTSPYYQAWLGAYVVFVDDGGPPFGFDRTGAPDDAAVGQLLEADQRLVLNSAGLMSVADPHPRVAVAEGIQVEHVVAWGGDWVRFGGAGETVSAFQRAGHLAGRRSRWLYGVAPNNLAGYVQEFHALTYLARVWLRYEPEKQATLAKFYVLAEYEDGSGRRWSRGRELESECRGLLDRIRFDHIK